MLNTLRVAMSIFFGVLVIVVGSVVSRLDAGLVDVIFWLGVAFSIVLMMAIWKLFLKIAEKTKEIGDL